MNDTPKTNQAVDALIKSIETDRLILREFTDYDLPALYDIESNIKVVQYLQWGPHTHEQTHEHLQMMISVRYEHPRTNYYLAIILKETDTLMGAICLEDSHDGTGNFGYILHPSYWGNGYATEAAHGIIRFGFDLGMHTIWADCHIDNHASIRVLEKVGLERKATFKDHRIINGKPFDFYYYSIHCNNTIEK